MSAKLYAIAVSHPSHAAKAMLDYKRIEHEVVNFPPLSQPIALRAVGFRGRTVPALAIEGRKVQGTLAISRALEELKPDPPLFPADRRAALCPRPPAAPPSRRRRRGASASSSRCRGASSAGRSRRGPTCAAGS